MKIKYVGKAGVRLIEEYRWETENGFIQDVKEPEFIENLLTYPDGSFIAVDSDGKKVDSEQALRAITPKTSKKKE